MRKINKKVKNTRTTTREYLLGDHWKNFIKKFSNISEVCEICGTPHWKHLKNGKWKCNRIFVFHHRHYNTVGHESREDVMRICKRCHDMCHKILRMKDDCAMVHQLKETVSKYFEYHPTERKKK